MVQLPDPEELHQLKTFNEPFSLTIYAPFIEVDPNGSTNPNRIELKNLLHEAETALLADGVEPRVVRKTLRPARALLENREFWPRSGESLALFLHPRFFRQYHLPGKIPYMLSVGRGFNLGPLMRVVRDNRPYLVLALSHKNVRMFEGDRFRIRQLHLRNFPTNMEESLGIDEYPKVSETHSIAPAGEKGSEAYHGQYNENETDKQMLFLFFRKIDASLHKFLQQKDRPVILAGVEYLLPIYRQANTSPYLVPGGLTGNFEHEDPEHIRRRAWKLIKNAEGLTNG
jgi:hypothetical protein